jgi:hypothetical protein
LGFVAVGYQIFVISWWVVVVYLAVAGLSIDVGRRIPLLAWGFAVAWRRSLYGTRRGRS